MWYLFIPSTSLMHARDYDRLIVYIFHKQANTGHKLDISIVVKNVKS